MKISPRNPISGKNCSGFRFRFKVRAISRTPLFLPIEMKSLPQILQLLKGESPLNAFNCLSLQNAKAAFSQLRKKYDFDFWAATEFFIHDANDADSIIPLTLNNSQHYVIDIMRKRYFHRQIGRYIITKSCRRCGLTTCIQAYILWMQTYQCKNNSYTCGASDINIHPIKSNLCRYLKRDIVPQDMGIFLPKVGWCAYFNTYHFPDAIRGINLGYVHLANMSFWRDKDSSKTRRAYCAPVSAVLLEYFTLVVLEGSIPKRQTFSIKEYVYAHKGEKETTRKKILSKSFQNPFFINEVITTHTTDSPYFHHIHLPIALNVHREVVSVPSFCSAKIPPSSAIGAKS